MTLANQIINEEIQKFLLRESDLSDIKKLLQDFKKKKTDKSDANDKEEKKIQKKLEKLKKGKKKLRKTVNGGKEYYDYNDYKRKHRKLNKGDTDMIRDTIDSENTDIAAVARKVFPDHTEEGAQSQLRKILNNERPMTNDVASKLTKMISQGKIAIK